MLTLALALWCICHDRPRAYLPPTADAICLESASPPSLMGDVCCGFWLRIVTPFTGCATGRSSPNAAITVPAAKCLCEVPVGKPARRDLSGPCAAAAWPD